MDPGCASVTGALPPYATGGVLSGFESCASTGSADKPAMAVTATMALNRFPFISTPCMRLGVINLFSRVPVSLCARVFSPTLGEYEG